MVETVRCPRCGSTNLITNHEGFLVCYDCGLVLDQSSVAYDWNSNIRYDVDNKPMMPSRTIFSGSRPTSQLAILKNKFVLARIMDTAFVEYLATDLLAIASDLGFDLKPVEAQRVATCISIYLSNTQNTRNKISSAIVQIYRDIFDNNTFKILRNSLRSYDKKTVENVHVCLYPVYKSILRSRIQDAIRYDIGGRLLKDHIVAIMRDVLNIVDFGYLRSKRTEPYRRFMASAAGIPIIGNTLKYHRIKEVNTTLHTKALEHITSIYGVHPIYNNLGLVYRGLKPTIKLPRIRFRGWIPVVFIRSDTNPFSTIIAPSIIDVGASMAPYVEGVSVKVDREISAKVPVSAYLSKFGRSLLGLKATDTRRLIDLMSKLYAIGIGVLTEAGVLETNDVEIKLNETGRRIVENMVDRVPIHIFNKLKFSID